MFFNNRRDLKFDYDAMLRKLEILTEKSGYDIIQSNGQRVYSPPKSRNIPKPPNGCEIFLGKLPRFMFEDELIPIVESVGKLYNFRLMVDFHGISRGFAFAQYFTPQKANLAVKLLNGYKLKNGLQIGVYKSVNNCRLFVGNIPRSVTKEEVHHALSEYVSGIVKVIMYYDVDDEDVNRGYVFVEFDSHRSAAFARRQLAPASLILFGRPLHVDWADPIPEVDVNELAQITKLFISNLPKKLTPDTLREILESFMGTNCILRVYKKYHYSFVHFQSRSPAEYCFELIKRGLVIQGRNVEVDWARAEKFSKKNRMNRQPTNLCKSVPPSVRRKVDYLRKFYSNSNSPTSNNSITSSSVFGNTSSTPSTPERYNPVQNVSVYNSSMPTQMVPSIFKNFQHHLPIHYIWYT